MEFSEKLKTLRTEKGLSQEKLAQQIHISRSAVAKWENGLGLPGEQSLQLLADCFGVTAEELLPDHSSAETLVQKNKTIEQQKNTIVGLVAGAGIGLFLISWLWIEPLRPSLQPIALGVLLVVLGVYNIQGNIASIHWYNRRRVSKEDQLPYCRLMGLGTLVIGAGLVGMGFAQAFASPALGEMLIGMAAVAGLALMLYAQMKYNKGLF